ncbi:MAG: UDP-2,3-diacylglucosamine diphosphatase LpxI [Kiritimatiellae bacterium]|nr:UDP-2,3-diacylglucosamine diphosphatase LpxI [Kiritimatiellia bacterium]
MISRLLVVAGAGSYPRLVIEGAKRAGVARVDVLSVRGSTEAATVRAADGGHRVALGALDEAVRWAGTQGYDGLVMAGQINPLSLFRCRFSDEVKAWLRELPTKNAHTIFRKLIEKFEAYGSKVLPASLYMDGHLPGIGPLAGRELTEAEASDVRRGMEVARDVGAHDVGQTVVVKSGMVLAVEAFEGTNAAIRRGGRLGGKGSVVFKAAREGHDMRFDIPVIGLKTLKVMKSAGATALAFQAGRLILLDREAVVGFANRHGIAVVGVDSGLPPAPLRP